jgi:hypothetical protein
LLHGGGLTLGRTGSGSQVLQQVSGAKEVLERVQKDDTLMPLMNLAEMAQDPEGYDRLLLAKRCVLCQMMLCAWRALVLFGWVCVRGFCLCLSLSLSVSVVLASQTVSCAMVGNPVRPALAPSLSLHL